MSFKSNLSLVAIAVGMMSNAWSADFTVINTNDAGEGSLRQAMTEANASPGLDRVRFNIPGEGLQIIRLATALPVITDPVEIDGYSQPGSSPNTLADADNAVRLIDLDGTSFIFTGLSLTGGSSVVKGLSLRRFDVGIRIESSTNLLLGNYVGSEVPGITNGNLVGIIVGSVCCNVIGGTQAADRNIITGNGGNSIRVNDSSIGNPARDTRILGNLVGVQANGISPSANPGSSGISIRAAIDTVVGGLEPGARNTISSGNGGVTVYGPATNTSVLGNYIGVGNDGITLLMPGVGGGVDTREGVFGTGLFPQTIRVEGNRIANYGVGVAVSGDTFEPLFSARRITIIRNEIFANERDGISLGIAARTNDVWDLDDGPNGRQNYPELSSAVFEDEAILITGRLETAPMASYRIEFFANTLAHPSGFGEGELYLGFTNVVTDINGLASFEVTFVGDLALKSFMTATATDADGNTSMFSRSLQARSFSEPMIHSNPKAVTVLPYTNVLFQADASGGEPVSLQWRHDGIDVVGATNLSLSLSNVVWEDRGSYVLVASNRFGVVESLSAQLTVVARPTILTQPADVFIFPGADAAFSVEAGGMLPIAFQWRRDGMNLPGATSPSLALTNVDWPMRGAYTVVASNAFGAVESEAAGLYVKVRPIITQQPLSQGVVSNGAVTLSIAISNSATLPLTYIWRSNNIPIVTETSMRHVALYGVENFKANTGYAVVVSNAFGPPGVLSARVNLTMLPDSDGDGLPDAYEDAYSLNRDDATDAALDSDNDGASNTEEYQAGTDPRDALNRLRIRQIFAQDGAIEIEFAASSNKTYAVQYHEAFTPVPWQTLHQLPASLTNRTVRVTDPYTGPRRFYRLATPQ